MKKILLSKEIDLKCIKIYLFGSFLKCNNPNDIDLLIVYDKASIKTETILFLRKIIIQKLVNYLNIDIDICLLTIEEMEQSKFVEMEKAFKFI